MDEDILQTSHRSSNQDDDEEEEQNTSSPELNSKRHSLEAQETSRKIGFISSGTEKMNRSMGVDEEGDEYGDDDFEEAESVAEDIDDALSYGDEVNKLTTLHILHKLL